ncbi:MAG: lytic transglycosylase domain-containing protein [Clostridia bacterium]|nr:lytic transglycosylase domain-containing protein [Clostridia bacterium]
MKKSNLIFILAFVVMIVLIAFAVKKPVEKGIYPLKYSEYVNKYCNEYDVDPALAFAVIKIESDFNPDALSYADAKGLMQLTDSTFDWMQRRLKVKEKLPPEALYDPETNLKFGIYLLSYLSQRYSGDYTLVLSAYHAGVGNVGSWLKNEKYSSDGVTLKYIPTSDTRSYVKKVLKARDYYKELYNL